LSATLSAPPVAKRPGRWHAAAVTITIRPARADDGVALQEIERLAGERFREVGMGEIADNEPGSVESLAAYATAQRSWVATTDAVHADTARGPVGYVLVDVVDSCAHVEQISVRPDHQGAGVGRALLDQVQAWAVETGRPALTLTTFTDVAWNRPLYEHIGFRVLADHEIGPELRSLRATETAHGLDPEVRVCMRLDL
jgi:GNAT superfamily N-acetyltransferase